MLAGTILPIESRCQKSAHNLVTGNLHKTETAFVTLEQNRLGFVQVIYCFHFLYCETESAKCSSISVIFRLSSKQIFCRFSEFSA